MEIIQKHWTKQEIQKIIGELMAQKNGAQALGADTTELDVLIANWTDRYEKLD